MSHEPYKSDKWPIRYKMQKWPKKLVATRLFCREGRAGGIFLCCKLSRGGDNMLLEETISRQAAHNVWLFSTVRAYSCIMRRLKFGHSPSMFALCHKHSPPQCKKFLKTERNSFDKHHSSSTLPSPHQCSQQKDCDHKYASRFYFTSHLLNVHCTDWLTSLFPPDQN